MEAVCYFSIAEVTMHQVIRWLANKTWNKCPTAILLYLKRILLIAWSFYSCRKNSWNFTMWWGSLSVHGEYWMAEEDVLDGVCEVWDFSRSGWSCVWIWAGWWWKRKCQLPLLFMLSTINYLLCDGEEAAPCRTQIQSVHVSTKFTEWPCV